MTAAGCTRGTTGIRPIRTPACSCSSSSSRCLLHHQQHNRHFIVSEFGHQAAPLGTNLREYMCAQSRRLQAQRSGSTGGCCADHACKVGRQGTDAASCFHKGELCLVEYSTQLLHLCLTQASFICSEWCTGHSFSIRTTLNLISEATGLRPYNLVLRAWVMWSTI